MEKYTLSEVHAYCICIELISSAHLLKNATDSIPLIETHPNEFLSNLRDFPISEFTFRYRSRYCVKCTNCHICLFNWTNDFDWWSVCFLNFYFGICFDFSRDFERWTVYALRSIDNQLKQSNVFVWKSIDWTGSLARAILYELTRSHILCMDDSYIGSIFFFKSKLFFFLQIKRHVQISIRIFINVSMKQQTKIWYIFFC